MENDALKKLLNGNKSWVESMTSQNPDYFLNISRTHEPEYLWIGCSDSRVPANQVIGLEPGKVFVHRNVGNLIVNTDLNCLSVLQYGIDELKIKNIIVCGHYKCAGINSAMQLERRSIADYWLRYIRNLYHRHKVKIKAIENVEQQADFLSEINVIEQVASLCQLPLIKHAWERGQTLRVFGCVYDIKTGLIKDLKLKVTALDQISNIYKFLSEFNWENKL